MEQHGRLRLRVLDENFGLVPLQPYSGETRERPRNPAEWFEFGCQEWTEEEWSVNQDYLDLNDPFATVQKKLCTVCEDAKPQVAFSSSQWSSKDRKCKECFEAYMAGFEGMVCTVCMERKKREKFTSSQRCKPKTRKCMDCQERRNEANEDGNSGQKDAVASVSDGMVCTVCEERKNREKFTKTQRAKAKTRKCMECQWRGEANEEEVDMRPEGA